MGTEKILNMFGKCSSLLARVGCLALFMMMGVTVVDVLGRFLFNAPILGAFEITQYLVVVMIFSFLGYAQSEKIHVNVDILVNTFPRKVRRIIDLINTLVCLLLMLLVTWMAFEKGLDTMASGDKPMNLQIPQYPFVFFLALGCGVMCVEFTRDIVRASANTKRGENRHES